MLAEVAGPDAVVLGIGLNVTTRAEELPPDRPATSVLLEGGDVPTGRRSCARCSARWRRARHRRTTAC